MASPPASSSTAAQAMATLAIGKPLDAEYATVCEYAPILKNPLIRNITLISIRPANGVKLFEESLILSLLFQVDLCQIEKQNFRWFRRFDAHFGFLRNG